MQLPDDFFKQETNSNIHVFKCASQVFSAKGQKKNFGSYVLLLCSASFIGAVIYYFLKGVNILHEMLNGFNKPNPPKKESSENRFSNKPSNNKVDYVKSDENLNNAEFDEAKNNDTRSYMNLYWSFLKRKQLFIFTFWLYEDLNLRCVKIGLFLLFISFYFAFTALFFNDSIMRQIYKYKGNTDAAVHVPNIVLSSLCCIIMNFLIKFISLSGRDMLKANKNPSDAKSIERKIKIKTIILFAVSFILMLLCWYYVSAFCAIFKNSQGHYFINVLISFIVCNLWPFVTSFIAPALRKLSFEKDSAVLYKISQIVAYF